MQKLNLNEIPQIEYIGYLWFDNSDIPKEINGPCDFSKINTHPFIIEGNLKAKDNTISVSIRYLDGEYIVIMVDWDKVDENSDDIEIVPHEYIAHGFGENKTLHFKEAWLPEPDPLCEDMKTLKPAWTAFNGFGTHPEVQDD